MALELFTNDAQSTTVGSIDDTTDPVTFTVTSAATFPTTGNFTIKIDSEYLLVTTVAGADFTASRAQESSVIASHLAGATVTLGLTAGSHKRIIGEFHGSGTYANRPAAATAGRLYFPTDNPGLIYRDSGSAWQIIAHGIGLFPAPSLALFGTWVNQQNATYAQLGDAIRFEDDGTVDSGNDLRIRVKTKTGTASATTIIGFRMYSNVRNQFSCGVAYRHSGTGVIFVSAAFLTNDQAAPASFCARYTDFNNHAATHILGNIGWSNDLIFIRSVWTTPNTFTTSLSKDGTKWFKYSEFTDANLSGLDQVGLYLNNVNPNFTDGSSPCGMDIIYLDHSEAS